MRRAPEIERLPALLVVCALAVASVIIAGLGVTPTRVSAQEQFGAARDPGESAFIAAHRGGADSAPENTLAAVEAALARGFDYVEVDLALTADGHAVLMHDATVDRTTDGSGPLADLTLEQVRALDAGSWYGPQWQDTRVPTAEEFFGVLSARGGRAILDIKGEWAEEAVAALMDQVRAADLEHRVVVASFDARTIAAVGLHAPGVTRLMTLRRLPDDVVLAAQQFGARGVIVSRSALAQRPAVVDELHAAGLRVIVYTLNSDRHWDLATGLGVDGIVTDDPGLLHVWQTATASG